MSNAVINYRIDSLLRMVSAGFRSTTKTPYIHISYETLLIVLTLPHRIPIPLSLTLNPKVFGGVHNYKTKMCEVYERLSGICVQVRDSSEACGRVRVRGGAYKRFSQPRLFRRQKKLLLLYVWFRAESTKRLWVYSRSA